jgi:hypothetical protein
MAYHPINLAVRFCLELVMLVAFCFWGWHLGHSIVLRLVLAVGFPPLAAVLRGVFAVSGDRSRSGKAPIPVPGSVRLLLEILLFGGAIWAFATSGLQIVAVCFGLAAFLHYLCSYERIAWLLRS